MIISARSHCKLFSISQNMSHWILRRAHITGISLRSLHRRRRLHLTVTQRLIVCEGSSISGEYNDADPLHAGKATIPFRDKYDMQNCNKRREWAEKFSSCSLKHTGQWLVDDGDGIDQCLQLKGNVENPIGLAKVPVGLVGPLLLWGEHVKGYTLCPFATTEGALTASATRGATALSAAGGVHVRTVQQCQTRAPAFQLQNMHEVDLLWKWMKANMSDIKKQASLATRHGELVEMEPVPLGRTLIVFFKYNTKDASGQNMVTACTSQACKWILEKITSEVPNINVTNFWMESNLSGDKKIAAMNMFRTRGIHAQAEAWIPEAILESVLKVDSKSLLGLYQVARIAAVQSGCVGSNINVINALAAIFIATGQDTACVGESASAQLILALASKEEIKIQTGKQLNEEIQSIEDIVYSKVYNSSSESEHDSGGVYASLVLPSLVLGTVGGGTGLATQRECLSLMGCYGKSVARFAEMVAGYALSLELSSLAAAAGGHYVSAHEKLGRNHPTHPLHEVKM